MNITSNSPAFGGMVRVTVDSDRDLSVEHPAIRHAAESLGIEVAQAPGQNTFVFSDWFEQRILQHLTALRNSLSSHEDNALVQPFTDAITSMIDASPILTFHLPPIKKDWAFFKRHSFNFFRKMFHFPTVQQVHTFLPEEITRLNQEVGEPLTGVPAEPFEPVMGVYWTLAKHWPPSAVDDEAWPMTGIETAILERLDPVEEEHFLELGRLLLENRTMFRKPEE